MDFHFAMSFPMKKNPFNTTLPHSAPRRALAELNSPELVAAHDPHCITPRRPLALSVPEAAWEIGVSKSTLYRWIEKELFPKQKKYPDESSKTSRILRAELDQWLSDRHGNAVPPSPSSKKKGGKA